MKRTTLALWTLFLMVGWTGFAQAADEKDKPKTEEKDEKKADAAPLFPDRILEAVVRQSVFDKRNNDEPLTEDDVRNIAVITAKGKGIQDLTGLEKCVSIASLDLASNAIEDLSALKGLKRLQSLNLAGNKIKDLTPLSGLTGLQYLHLAGNQISDLAPVAKLRALTSLYLSDNDIKYLRHVGDLRKLWSLYLDGNAVEDSEPLRGLTNLSSLDLRDNQVSALSPLLGLTDLKYLFLEGNKVKTLASLVAMARIDAEGDQRFAPYWRIYLADNPLSDDAKGDQIAELKKLGARISLERVPSSPKVVSTEPPEVIEEPAEVVEAAEKPEPTKPAETAKAPAAAKAAPTLPATALPGTHHGHLARFVGDWKVTFKWRLTPDADPIEGTGTVYKKMILGGRYLEEEVWLDVGGQLFHGRGVMGYDNVAKTYHSTWVDNTTTASQTTTGTCSDGGRTLTLEGEALDPATGKTVKTRSILRIVSNNEHKFEVLDVGDDGKTVKRIEATLSR